MAKSKSSGRAAAGRPKPRPAPASPAAESYQHPTADAALRPDAGTQAQFRKKRPPVTYKYDSSLSPALDFDSQNPAREVGESQLPVVSSQLQELRKLLSSTTDDKPVTTDQVKMTNDSWSGGDVPAWFLDTDYNGLCFHVCQAFFPRTAAWDNLRKSLRATYDESVWDHLAGSASAPFEPGNHKQIAVKVIDDRGNELLVVKKLSEAK